VRACLLIPIYDHGATIRDVVRSVLPLQIPILVVNDGSHPGTRAVLDEIAREQRGVEILHHDRNRGKGEALKTGYRAAAARGYTHVLQLDADGQHDADDAQRFLEAAKTNPEALVLGEPIFDDDAPKSRLYGRKLSVGMVWVATLSRVVRDPLCGYRVTPLGPANRLLDRVELGDWMDFEPEIAVRLVWMGVPVVNVPTRVRYFPGGVSHFDVIWDDVRLAWLYTRLTLGMLARAPGWLAERISTRRIAR
jgi:glycosyltransferase involved in cell wall biosynthesis